MTNFLFTRNCLFKHKEVVSNLHVCSNGHGKCDLRIRDVQQSIFSSRYRQNDLPNT